MVRKNLKCIYFTGCKESKESNYWLRIIKAANISDNQDLDYLIQESNELKNIFGKSMKTMSR